MMKNAGIPPRTRSINSTPLNNETKDYRCDLADTNVSRLQLLSRDQIEENYGLSKRWLELVALTGDGPPMVRISRRMVRYQRGAFEAWLESRVVQSTSDCRGVSCDRSKNDDSVAD